MTVDRQEPTPHFTRVARFEALAALALSTLSFPQDHPHSITGRVLDPTGRPVPGASISILPENERGMLFHERTAAPDAVARGTSGADGTFVVDLPSNDVTQWIAVAEAGGFAPRIENELGSGADVEMVLGPPARMHGEVLDSEDRPVAGASLHWFALDWGVILERFAVSDAEGRYELADLPETSRITFWRVILEAEGFAPLTVELEPERWNNGGFVQVRPFEVVHHFVLSRGAVVDGRVLDETSQEPIAGAEVVLWSLEGRMTSGDTFRSTSNPYGDRELARTASAEDGGFHFEHVPVEGFHGTASHNGNGTSKWLGGVDARADGHAVSRENVESMREGERKDLVLRLPPANGPGRARPWAFDADRVRKTKPAPRPIAGTRSLRGHCTLLGDRPFESQRVIAWSGTLSEDEVRDLQDRPFRRSTEPLTANRLRADGTFELRGLPDGPLWLSFPGAGKWVRVEGSEELEIELKPYPSAGGASVVLDSIVDASTNSFVVPKSISLRLETPADPEVPSLLEYTRRPGFPRRGHPIGTHRYAVPLLSAGQWTLIVEQPGFELHREPVEITGDELLHRSVALHPAALVRGRILGIELARDCSPMLILRREDGGTVTAPIDSEGRFDTPSLGPGRYRASIVDTQSPWQTSPIGFDRLEILDIPDGAPLVTAEWRVVETGFVKITLQPKGVEKGRLTLGGPFRGSDLRVEEADGSLYSPVGEAEYGPFCLSLPAGRSFVLRLFLEGVEVESAQVQLAVGEEREIEWRAGEWRDP